MKATASTQDNIPIAGIKDGVAIMKDGQYRLILSVSAINFNLKSEQEQNSIIFQFQGFLNALHFPIEIVIQSKKLDLSPYLNKIKSQIAKQTNELLKVQTEDYVDFVSQLINLANIMKKSFYVVVGYQPMVAKQGFLDKLIGRTPEQVKLVISEDDFLHHSKELRQRAQTVASGLGGIGLHCAQLSTEEIIELFYEIYNPDIAGKERLGDSTAVSGAFYSTMKTNTKEADGTGAGAEEVIDNSEVVAEAAKKDQMERAKALAEEEKLEEEARKGNVEVGVLPGEDPSPIGAEASPSPKGAVTGPSGQSDAVASPPTNEPVINPTTQSGGVASTGAREALPEGVINVPNSVNTHATNQPIEGVDEEKAVSDDKLNKDYGW